MPIRKHDSSVPSSSEMHQSSRNTSDLVEVDPFTQAFHEIDTDSDGVISRADLENFVRRNDIEDGTLVRVS